MRSEGSNIFIREVRLEELDICLKIIRESFATVAEEFHLTVDNCPTNAAFLSLERLEAEWKKGNRMFAVFCGEQMVGFMELEKKSTGVFIMEKLAVLPEFRERGYGAALVDFAKATVLEAGAHKIDIGIIEKNTILKEWYLLQGFREAGTKDFPHLPFTVGFLEWIY